MAAKALVTGGTGFLGSAIVRELLANGEEVAVFRRASSDLGNLQGLEVGYAIGDLTDFESLQRAMEGVDRVYHCAALYDFSGGYDRYLAANVQGTKNVLRAAEQASVKRVVHTSTIAAVGSAPKAGQTITEETIWNFGPLNSPYMTSKFIAEYEALRIGAERGLEVVVVNPAAPIGQCDSRPTPTGKIVLNLLKGRYPAVVPSAFPMVDVDDCAKHHRLAMEKGKAGHRYLSVAQTMDFVEMARVLSERVGSRMPLRMPRLFLTMGCYGSWLLPQFLNRFTGIARFPLRHFAYDCGKSERELGMTFRPMEDALERAGRWYVEKGFCKPPKRFRKSPTESADARPARAPEPAEADAATAP